MIVTALLLTAFFLALATSTSRAGPGGIVGAVICVAGAAAVVYRIQRRPAAS